MCGWLCGYIKKGRQKNRNENTKKISRISRVLHWFGANAFDLYMHFHCICPYQASVSFTLDVREYKMNDKMAWSVFIRFNFFNKSLVKRHMIKVLVYKQTRNITISLHCILKLHWKRKKKHNKYDTEAFPDVKGRKVNINLRFLFMKKFVRIYIYTRFYFLIFSRASRVCAIAPQVWEKYGICIYLSDEISNRQNKNCLLPRFTYHRSLWILFAIRQPHGAVSLLSRPSDSPRSRVQFDER